MNKQSHRHYISSLSRHIMQILCLCWISFFVIYGAGCNSANSKTPDNSTRDTIISKDPNIVEMAHPEQFQLVTVESRKVADETHLTGVITPDINRSVAILSLSGGRVVDIKVKLGDDVKKGQLLLRIHSTDLAAAFSDYQKATADELLARKQLERSEALYNQGKTIAQKDLEAARDTADKAQIDVKTSRDHVIVLGGDPGNVSPIIDIRSPISGTIVEQNITDSAGVRSLDNSPNLFTVADLSRVWAICDLYEDIISKVHIDDAAEVRLNAYPDRLLHGRVSNISRVLDAATRTAKVRIELDNPERLIRSGMFITATLHSVKSLERPVLPLSAIVRLHDKDWVFMSLGGNQFQKTEVQTGPLVEGNLQQILAGVKIGDKVVANGLQLFSASETK